jgi:Ca-activated chloride channel family protein
VKFLWPEFLWITLLLPALVLAYLWLLRRRRKAVIGYSSLTLIKQAMASSWRRHVPALLILAAAACLVLAAARPMASMILPTQQRTIILVMDVSGSMIAEDVAPNRISASQAAAKAFATQLPAPARIGVVAYGGTAHLVQPPTLSREDVIAAIDRFQLQRGTAIGSGIVVAMATLFPDEGIEVAKLEQARSRGRSAALNSGKEHDPAPSTPVAPGSYESAAVVLLTDGQNTTGPEPMDAAQIAANHGVKIFTVGFGTPEGVTIGFEGWSMRVRLDEDTLKKIANLTQGEYFPAASGADLHKVYEALRSRLVFEKKETEVTVFFAMAAALLMLAGVGLSVWWFGKVA